jgi:hypothetical protein
VEKLSDKKERIENILRAEVERARGLYEQERARFQGVTREVPSGIPYPDSVTRIRTAADDHNLALDAYKTALKRFNDYAINRIIPNDLKP